MSHCDTRSAKNDVMQEPGCKFTMESLVIKAISFPFLVIYPCIELPDFVDKLNN